MKAVVATNTKIKEINLGCDHAGAQMTQVPFSNYDEMDSRDRISREVGTIFKPKYDCKRKNLNFHITKNSYKNAKFRMTFYSIEDELPKDIIVNQDIIFDIKDQNRGWIKVDLEPYYIFVQNRESFAVTLTLLDKELDNEQNWFVFSAASLPNYGIFRRDKAMDSWKKSNGIISVFRRLYRTRIDNSEVC